MEKNYRELENLLSININNLKIINKFLKNGVEFLSTDGVVISTDAVIGAGTKIYPGTILEGKVIIGKNCMLGPNTFVKDSVVEDGTTINSSQVRNSKIGKNVSIGPFAQLRPNCEIFDNVHIGNFVEVKNSKISSDTSLSHLSYIGDSTVGSGVNIGCGTVTVNYDGKKKHSCVIEDNVFLGCQTALIAPVTIGEGAFTAAGSVITEDVPKNSLGIGRAKQVNKEGWARGKYKKIE